MRRPEGREEPCQEGLLFILPLPPTGSSPCAGREPSTLEPQSLHRDTKAQRCAGAYLRSHSKSGTKVRGKELGTVLGLIHPTEL